MSALALLPQCPNLCPGPLLLRIGVLRGQLWAGVNVTQNRQRLGLLLSFPWRAVRQKVQSRKRIPRNRAVRGGRAQKTQVLANWLGDGQPVRAGLDPEGGQVQLGGGS